MKEAPDLTTFEDIVQPKPIVHIEGWKIAVDFYGREHLTGRVHDHPRFLPDTLVRTSPIDHWDDDGNAVTQNTIYVLGDA